MTVLIIIVIVAFIFAFLLNWGYYEARQELEEKKALEELKIKRQQLEQTAEKDTPQGPKPLPYQMNGKTHYAQPGDPMYEALIKAMREDAQ